MNIEEEQLLHALQMMRIDFEQRSQQVIALALDRSKFIRIGLLVWAAPLLIAAQALSRQLDQSQLFVTPLEIVGISFYAAALVSCVILTAMLGNRNSTNLAASGMNYLRSYYFKVISDKNLVSLPENLQKLLNLDSPNAPQFNTVVSRSTDWMLVFTALVNVLYAGIGLYLLFDFNRWGGIILFATICVAHILVFHRSNLSKGLMR